MTTYRLNPASRPVATVLLAMLCGSASGQNLVPNGGFEMYTSCPTSFSQIDSALYWINPSTNTVNTGSPDYYHKCVTASMSVGVPNNWTGYQPAYAGSAYAGEYLYSQGFDSLREYMEVPLTSALLPGQNYVLEMYVNLANCCKLSTSDIQACFTNTAVTGVNNYFPLPLIPQIGNSGGIPFDTASWTKVTGTFTAAGGESYLIIGNFLSDANTLITTYNPSGQYNFVYVFVDDVSLVPEQTSGIVSPENQQEISLFPNPAGDQVLLKILHAPRGDYRLELSDALGRCWISHDVEIRETVFRMTLAVGSLVSGIYSLTVAGPDVRSVRKLIKQ